MTRLAGRYELGDELGSGGMARVVEGYDHSLDRPVAIKLLHARPDDTARRRFLNEARAAARIHHPNAVAVHDAGEHDGQPYLVMELVRGHTLAEHLAEAGPVPPEDAVAVTLGILEALIAAHRRGLVHRDVKPGNVLLPTEGGVKLADFGIAKALDDATSGLTAPGVLIGTASYVAPELVEGGPASPASDVYSVGCVLYELLTGRPPFSGETPLSVAYAHVRTPVPPLRGQRAEVPRGLASVVERALAKDPADRYPDAEAMRAALLEGPEAVPAAVPAVAPDAAAGGAPTDVIDRGPEGASTATHAVSTDGAAPTWQRRWPFVVGLVVAGLLLLAAIGVGRGWLPGTDPTPAEVADTDPEQAPAEDEDGDPDPGGDAPSGDQDPGGDADDEPGPPDHADASDDAGPPDHADDGEGSPDEAASELEAETLADLIALLAAASGQYGEKQGDLLDALVELSQEDDPEDRAEDAADLREDVADWVADGELDPAIGDLADRILAGIAGG